MTLDLAGASVVVTGGAGFLGRRVVDRLVARNAKPIVVRSADHDLTNPDAVRAVLAENAPDYVIHLAAVVGGIGANRAHPAKFFHDNAVMGIHLLHEAWASGVKKMVVAGTVCSYPKHTPVPFMEASLWDGYPEETNAPYGLAKKMLLVQGQAYRAEFGFNCIHLIPTNLYGPGDNFDPETSHVIPALIRKCLEAKLNREDEIVLWGTGSATREFLYVDDAAEGIVKALEVYDSGEPVNLGSGKEIAIRDLAGLIAKATNFDGKLVWDDSYPDGQPRRSVSGDLAKSVLGWAPSVDFREGIEATVEWYAEALASLR